ncbi:MAG: hypothetical protein MJ183_05840 [Treponemataceae bacterium]|nr:hypothetical protein [Treponemataceae bacterium]
MKKLANYAVIGLILVALVAITSCGTPFAINTAINGKCYVHYDGTETYGVIFDSQTSYTYYEITKGASKPSVANHFTDYEVDKDSNDKSIFYVSRPNPNKGLDDVKVWRISQKDLNTLYRNNDANTKYTSVSKAKFEEIFKGTGKDTWKYVNGKVEFK